MDAKTSPALPFDPQRFLDSTGAARRMASYRRSSIIFEQGDPSTSVMYIQSGAVKLSVTSKTGKAAVVAMFGPGDFFGEGCLAGQPLRTATATAVVLSRILIVQKDAMIRLLREQHAFSDRFIAHMLARNIRIEEDLVDHLFKSSEKRLARTLLLIGRDGAGDQPARVLPKLSQEVLAEMIGTTLSRVNFFMNKFRKLGFIEYNRTIRINTSLLSVVLHD